MGSSRLDREGEQRQGFEVWGNLGDAFWNRVRGAGVQGQELPDGREPSESEGALTWRLGSPPAARAGQGRSCP